MMSCNSKDDRLWWGLVAFVVGAVVLLQKFNVVPSETWNYLWPSILVVSGLKWMLAGHSDCGSSCCSSKGSCEMSCKDCGSEPCSCDSMPMPKKSMGKAKKSKRK